MKNACSREIKISIVTACFNAGETIERTIKSVKNQDYHNIEFILIDAKSSDNTMQVVDRYRDLFAVIISEQDKGVSDGFNKGVALAAGDVIVILNADDELCPHALRHVNESYDGISDIYYGDCIVIDDENRTEKYQKAFDVSRMKYSLLCCHQSIYITKKCYEKYGWYSLKYKLCTDYDLIARMYQGGAKFRYIPYPLCKYRQGGCTYVNPYATIKEDMKIARKNGLGCFSAICFSGYYLGMCYGKRVCEKLKILNEVRKIRQFFNRQISYKRRV